MTCEEVRALLPAYVDGDAERAAEVDAHLAWCGGCRGELAAYRQVKRTLASLREEGAPPGPHLLDRLVALIPAPSLLDRVRLNVYDHPSLYVAALGVGAAFLLWRRVRAVRAATA
ncbi:MAG TPA: zf-HC2 domain-containing protein [Actinomycetota bacterium]|nr:zf-HC2 domain-containing protein [Actinomycetota bacterium]